MFPNTWQTPNNAVQLATHELPHLSAIASMPSLIICVTPVFIWQFYIMFNRYYNFFSSLSAYQCRQSGACIHFTVMDHDILVANDFAGEAFLSLNTIPGISGEEISGFSALTPLSLPLTQPKRGISKYRCLFPCFYYSPNMESVSIYVFLPASSTAQTWSQYV